MNPFSLDSMYAATQEWLDLGLLHMDAQVAIGRDVQAGLSTAQSGADVLIALSTAASRSCTVSLQVFNQGLTLAGRHVESSLDAAFTLQPVTFPLARQAAGVVRMPGTQFERRTQPPSRPRERTLRVVNG